MYFSYIRPILEYGDIIWDNCFENEKEKVEKIQIEAGRIVTEATKSCSIPKIYEEIKWDTLDKRRYNHRMITYFKMTRKNTPSYLYTLLPPSVHQVSERNLRSGSNFHIPRSRTTLHQNSFVPKTAQEWNSLPDHIKVCPSINTFKQYVNRNTKNVPKYYYISSRKLQILHTILRLSCSSVIADLFRNHVSETDKCGCGLPETAEHFLLSCRFYTIIRNNIFGQINVPFNIDTLLRGCPLYSDDINGEIFSAVQSFIHQSRRFY